MLFDNLSIYIMFEASTHFDQHCFCVFFFLNTQYSLVSHFLFECDQHRKHLNCAALVPTQLWRLLEGLSVSFHQICRWVFFSPSEFLQCESNSSRPWPSFGMSWFCGFPFFGPTAVLTALCFGTRTERCLRMTGPTRCSYALMVSEASQTGTGTAAPSSSLPEKQDVNTVYEVKICHEKAHAISYSTLIQFRFCYIFINGFGTWEWGKTQGAFPVFYIGGWGWEILVFLILRTTGLGVWVLIRTWNMILNNK